MLLDKQEWPKYGTIRKENKTAVLQFNQVLAGKRALEYEPNSTRYLPEFLDLFVCISVLWGYRIRCPATATSVCAISGCLRAFHYATWFLKACSQFWTRLFRKPVLCYQHGVFFSGLSFACDGICLFIFPFSASVSTWMT